MVVRNIMRMSTHLQNALLNRQLCKLTPRIRIDKFLYINMFVSLGSLGL